MLLKAKTTKNTENTGLPSLSVKFSKCWLKRHSTSAETLSLFKSSREGSIWVFIIDQGSGGGGDDSGDNFGDTWATHLLLDRSSDSNKLQTNLCLCCAIFGLIIVRWHNTISTAHSTTNDWLLTYCLILYPKDQVFGHLSKLLLYWSEKMSRFLMIVRINWTSKWVIDSRFVYSMIDMILFV